MNSDKFPLDHNCFSSRIILITGAGRGIGRAAALHFARLGGKVIIAEWSDEGQETLQAIQSNGGQALFVKTDVSNERDVSHLAEQVKREFGTPDILVNNAIYCPYSPVSKMSIDMWDRVMAVNLRGTFLICKSFLPEMLLRKSGHIINMVSMDAMPGLSAYIASKQGIQGFSQSLHAEVSQYGLRVVAFAPGMVDTPGIRSIVPDLSAGLGLTSEQLMNISLHPAYAGLMPVEDAANATVILAALYMDEYDGETIDGYTILELAGLISNPVTTVLHQPQPVQPETSAYADLRAATAYLNQKLIEILVATGEELNQLPVFARPMARSGFKRKAGLRLQDWVHNAGEISTLLNASNGLQLEQLGKLSDYRQKIKCLQAYYQGIPAETARFTRDQEMLRVVQHLTDERLEVIQQLDHLLSLLGNENKAG